MTQSTAAVPSPRAVPSFVTSAAPPVTSAREDARSSPHPAVVPPLTVVEMGSTPYADQESYSPFCVKVNRALRVYGLTYERRASSPPAAKKYDPRGQVPILLVGEEPVADSTSILERLETLATRSLVPTDPRERAEAWLWEELADSALNGFLVAARWADEDNWPLVKEAYFLGAPLPVRALLAPYLRRGVVERLVGRDIWRAGPEACWTRFGKLLDHLEERAPESGYWVSKTISVADLAIFAQLHCLRSPLTAKQRDWVAERPRLTAYLDRIHRETGVPDHSPV